MTEGNRRRTQEELENLVLQQGTEIEELKAQVSVLMRAVASLTASHDDLSRIRSVTPVQNNSTSSSRSGPASPSSSSSTRNTTAGSSSMNAQAPSFTPSTFNASQPRVTTSANQSYSSQDLPRRCEFGTNCRKEHCASLHKSETESWCAICRLHCVCLVPSELNGMFYYYKQCYRCGFNDAPIMSEASALPSTSSPPASLPQSSVNSGTAYGIGSPTTNI